MTALLREAPRGSLAPLRQKLRCLGVRREDELDDILSRIRVGPHFDRGHDILAAGCSPRHSTVLICGVASLYERLVDGSRQIYLFQYPGDFCDVSRHVLHATTTEIAVGAATECWTGAIENHVLEQLLAQYPAFGMALWRSTSLETSALRARLLSQRKPALQHVAHLLCEHLARQSAIGLDDLVIPVCQLELADAAGLSVVHMNRTCRELQRKGFLTKAGRSMKVVDPDGLARLAGFDGRYLDIPSLIAGWDAKL